ncbi:site-specific DNA-methyltransferase [Nitrosococcus watsonii]|uniref:site-specific DNA-methyltransferase (adenine-specific) n=1 Tax=Nitrosococcus watsoni (strain C-113) TaxID=105559 RepID=D8KBZ8_NITWC|nr:site-specific DNA-methyltransferase [Nitrosococcus watsonii]ADJ29669.1 Site-specific DNA-methyltransferase (adenine-specific) [Nitrosococcus watsonii C-113]
MKKIQPEEGESADIVSENIERLKELFPEAFRESGVNFDVLRQLLDDAKVLDEGEEKYGLNWHGKKKARQIALTPSTGTLLPCPEESVDWDTTKNLFIEGDNLEVLKLLQKSYANKVKMIYIDPPYNTGKEFIYPDKFQENLDTYLKYTGQVDDEGMKLSSNSESTGRKHTNWLNMMLPRLKLARNLLTHDGVIFISIDDNEIANLKLLCNDIFGEECFAGKVIVLCNPKGRSQDKYLASCHEYLLIYTKSVLDKGQLNAPKSKDEIAKDYPFQDERGVYRELELRNTHREFGKFNRPNLYYPFYVDEEGCIELEDFRSSTAVLPVWDDGFEGCWTWGKEKARKQLSELVAKKVSSRWKIYRKGYASDDGELPTKQLKSIWSEKRHHTEKGQKAFNDLFGTKSKLFQSPKSLDVIGDAIAICQDKDMIVLDFFSGSGSSAHAMMAENSKDNGSRRFISVQLPELIDEGSEAFKAGFRAISKLAIERIRLAAKSIRDNSPEFSGDLGVKFFKLGKSNINVWNPDHSDIEESLFTHQELLVQDRTEQDVLYELLLKRGVDLAVPIESRDLNGKTIYSIGYGVLFACLDESITKDQVEVISQGIVEWHRELAPSSDTHIFFRDSAFSDDVSKTNMAAILEQNGINHVRSL